MEDLDLGKLYRTSYDFSVSTLIEMISTNRIRFPAFQRPFFWDVAMRSRFIESLVLNFPIPGIILLRTEDYSFEVVDGLNRLKSLQSYVNNEYRLKNLELLSDLNGMRFEDLPERDRKRLTSYSVNSMVIESDSKYAIYEVFARLNSGGVSLSRLEILKASYENNSFTRVVENIGRVVADTSTLLRQFNKSSREDIIINFVALADNYLHYSPPINKFINYLRHGEINESLVARFLSSLESIEAVLGSQAFRMPLLDVYDADGYSVRYTQSEHLEFSTKLSKRMAESQIISFSHFETQSIIRNSHLIYRRLTNLYSSPEFYGLGTGMSRRSIVGRIELQKGIINDYAERI